jgi:hypothetical protein
MRTITVCCSRCGAAITGGHSMLNATAGHLVNRLDDPAIDLCTECVDRFVDWLRGSNEIDMGVVADRMRIIRRQT